MGKRFKNFRQLVERNKFPAALLSLSAISISVLAMTGAFAQPAHPAVIKPVTVEKQAETAAATQTESVPALTAKNIADDQTATKSGLVPVKPVSITFMFAQLHQGKIEIGKAYLNTTTQLVDYVATDKDGFKSIVIARYLEAQTAKISDAITTAGGDLTVTGSGSAPSVINPSANTNAYANRASYLTNITSAAQPANGSDGGNPFVSGIFIVTLSMLFLYFIFRTLRRVESGNRMTLAKNVRRSTGISDEERPTVTFADVAGCDEAIDEMQELVEFLKNPERFAATGARAPRGAILVGPPGTGKTLLARAVAGESGLPFFAAAGSDFTEMYVGVGASRVRELFTKARSNEDGAIIFIDEIDAIGRTRSGSGSSGNQETENTLNALLVEMDGFSKSNIVVIAATNRDDILDKALTRPGRLDKVVQVPLPDRRGRERILRVHAEGKPLVPGVNLDLIARRTPGMSGAELAQVVNEAATVAARKNRDTITDADFDHAVATVAMGKARTSAVVTDHDRVVTAWHEAGHTVSALVIPEADNAVSVSIIPRGPAGGVTWMAQGDDLFLTRRRAFARLVVAMSGRAAEELLLDGEFTSGPHGDLQAATDTALAMVTQYGMTDTGLMIRSSGLLSTGARMTDETVDAVERLLAEALEVARKTLRDHRSLFDKVVEGLLEYDTLTASQLEEMQAGLESIPAKMPPAPVDYRRKAPVRERVVVKPVVVAPEPEIVPAARDVVVRDLLGAVAATVGTIAGVISLFRGKKTKAK
jgi:cell division protease FtsH